MLAKVVRSTLKQNGSKFLCWQTWSLKLNASISDSKVGGLRTMLAEDQKWGVPDRWENKFSFWPRTFDLEAVEIFNQKVWTL